MIINTNKYQLEEYLLEKNPVYYGNCVFQKLFSLTDTCLLYQLCRKVVCKVQ